MYPLSVLSPTAYKILADPDKVPTPAARLFLRLLVDFDLRKYRALNMVHLLYLYGGNRMDMARSVNQLVLIGLLERGPLSRKPRLNTYRVNPAYLMSPRDLEEHFRETQAVQERLTLLPRRWARTVA